MKSAVGFLPKLVNWNSLTLVIFSTFKSSNILVFEPNTAVTDLYVFSDADNIDVK